MDIDYKKPILNTQCDYRTSASRAHSFKLSFDRNFIPLNAHKLCHELKKSVADYRPKSETTKEFQWKINPERKFREEFSAPVERVQYNHQFTDKMKAGKLIKPLSLYQSRAGDTVAFPDLPRDIKFPAAVYPPPIEHIWKESYPQNTSGYYPHLDYAVSTTNFDFHPHKDYKNAQTNLIVQKELPFNANVAFFKPNTKLIKEYPLHRKYDSEHLRDVSKFPTRTFDRITLLRTRCRMMNSETLSSF